MMLKRKFYERETVTVARQLLGKVLTHQIGMKHISGIITETEAYRGNDDPASHAAVRMTDRNKLMFDQVGISYVYFTYGIYFMFNVVAKSRKQNAGAVLIRGIYPQKGISIMEKNRRVDDIKKLADGPGKLTQAMGITMKQYGEDLTKKTGLYISDGMKISKTIQKSRIGISKGLDKHWNFSFNVNDYL